MIDDAHGNKDCATYRHFEDVIARDDIDAVLISLPDHWHAIPAIAAAQAGKHIWGEKPLSHTLVEGRAMVDAVQQNVPRRVLSLRMVGALPSTGQINLS